ncbi:uncharacterized protein LOC131682465 isoform X2 [Topomyia yanbarensis]|uniref:uncharacterized protein LOC131682465 isoform X2 n=1 Tax=Topomyia yanbarensis TaxID=2498891 RepID=UPI00273C3958|nr:uncharacterized protein LOC131682465 isoform X2 [Topomyia yanbarensis]
MGGKYIPVATKKLRVAANSKNLEFLTNPVQVSETKCFQNITILLSYLTLNSQVKEKNTLPIKTEMKDQTKERNRSSRLLKNSVRGPNKAIDSKYLEDSTDGELMMPINTPRKTKSQSVNTRLSKRNNQKSAASPGPKNYSISGPAYSDEAKSSVLGSLELYKDWEEPEWLDCSKPGPSSNSARMSIFEQIEGTGKQEMAAGRNTSNKVKRTYLAKRVGKENTMGNDVLDGILSQDECGENRDTPTAEINECTCGQQSAIEQLQSDNSAMKKQIQRLKQALREATNRCFKLTDTLNSKVFGDPHKEIFTEVEGYPSREQLIAFSDQGIKSDYTFVRLLMEELWPNGYVNRSVSGRSSNNPLGRPRRVAVNNPSVELPTNTVKRVPLEPEKVKYIRDRLLEHRIYRGDSPAAANIWADESSSIMRRILAYYGKK